MTWDRKVVAVTSLIHFVLVYSFVGLVRQFIFQNWWHVILENILKSHGVGKTGKRAFEDDGPCTPHIVYFVGQRCGIKTVGASSDVIHRIHM